MAIEMDRPSMTSGDPNRHSDVPPAVTTAVQQLQAGFDDFCAEIYRLSLAVSPELADQTAEVQADIRRWQRWLIRTGLAAMLADRPFEDLGAAISTTVERRREHRLDLSVTLAVGDAALRVVADRLIRELGPARTVDDMAYVNRRMLEFLRVLSVHSAGPPGAMIARPDRPEVLAQLLGVLLAEPGEWPDDARPVQESALLAAGAGVRLPIRHVLALPADSSVAELGQAHPEALIAAWQGCVLVASARPTEMATGVRFGSATVPRGGGPALLAGLAAARRALQVAVVTGRAGLADEEAVLIGAVLEVPEARAQAAIRACFGTLADSPRGTELLDTLSAVLTWGQAAVAARAMHLHRHTLEYRLRQVQELTGHDLADPVVRLRCQLALLHLGRWPFNPA